MHNNMNNRMTNNMSNTSRNNNCSIDDCCNFPIGMGYVPWQSFGNIYDLDRGFKAGTIFPCLDKPFLGRSGCK